MKTLYLDCGMGAAGDMLTAALIELLPDADGFVEKMNGLRIPGVKIEKEKAVKCGITGTHISVKVHGVEECEGENEHSHEHEGHHGDGHGHTHEQERHHGDGKEHEEHHEHEHHHGDGHEHHHEDEHNHEHEHSRHHHHSSMHEIEHIIMDLNLPPNVQEDILAVYSLIAEAESHAHGVPATDIHFHEVGTMDAIADVTAVCMLMNELAPDEVIVSPVHVGSGTVKCAHGILPVPAPATAFILKDVPIYGGSIKGELCTPTGAALLKHFATAFADMPVMKTKAIGYGMGKKDFETVNCVRAMLGESGDKTDMETGDKTDLMLELSCNVDDMTAEEIGFVMERLFEEGAREVYTIPIGMKKSRPGTLIRVICLEEDREKMLALMFKHTTTIGIRETVTKRYILDRSLEIFNTPYGEVRCKVSSGYGVSRTKYEYDDLQRIAKERNMSLDEVRECLPRHL